MVEKEGPGRQASEGSGKVPETGQPGQELPGGDLAPGSHQAPLSSGLSPEQTSVSLLFVLNDHGQWGAALTPKEAVCIQPVRRGLNWHSTS